MVEKVQLKNTDDRVYFADVLARDQCSFLTRTNSFSDTSFLTLSFLYHTLLNRNQDKCQLNQKQIKAHTPEFLLTLSTIAKCLWWCLLELF